MIQLKDLSRFETFLHLLAGRVGQLVNYASLAGDVGVSATTIKNWVSILKASYILFELPPWFANIRKRMVKSPKLYFVDVALAAWLLGLETPAQIERDPLRGALYENLLMFSTTVLVKILTYIRWSGTTVSGKPPTRVRQFPIRCCMDSCQEISNYHTFVWIHHLRDGFAGILER